MKFFYFFIFLFNLVTCYDGDPIQSYYGTIVGTKITVLGEEMTEYLGIPYAQIPMHSWRFQPPHELNKDQFNGTYYAVFKSEGCPQNIRVMGFDGYDASNPKNGTDENCLKLNMWVPKDQQNMPVIVFFHGGSWTVRTGSADKFNGSVLAL
ncbi:Acetylcholinesterase, partial [Strongyloides ratti]